METKTKVNTDASISRSHNRFSFAFVAGNHKREVLEVRSSCREGNIEPENVEVMGRREALNRIKGQQLSNVIVETDVVQAIRGSSILLSYFDRLI